jgi:hypothetical protein
VRAGKKGDHILEPDVAAVLTGLVCHRAGFLGDFLAKDGTSVATEGFYAFWAS